MKLNFIAAGVIALASPAFAQTTPAEPETTSQSMPMPETSAPATSSASPAPAPAAAASDPKAIIASEFPTYDKDGDGALASAEFGAWMIALKEKSGDTAMKPAEKTSWLKSAFTTADKDKSKSVTLAELTDYLTAAG